MKWPLVLSLVSSVVASVHPIIIRGHYFVDGVTQEPFYIKGIDYQPGGSSGVSPYKDPLSDPKICARDIILFQDLGINTIRVYSINPELNHDACMTMLASAGIYLVLDVNSPLPGQHLNRYEPWTTYNPSYMQHVFKVVEQFSYYNNTLGFFAGNEIINDDISAKHASTYVKGIIRDIKMYIEKNSPRPIPVGYSAADDLRYRMHLANYLACVQETAVDALDFYGVNSYQWCGEQTFYTSGYNILVDDYAQYPRPIFFSEYVFTDTFYKYFTNNRFGCNEVTPRSFEEVRALYSTDMIDVFKGGLVYEFSQEPNNYGLIDILPNGDVQLLEDFVLLKSQLDALPEIDSLHVANSMRKNAKDIQHRLKSHQYALQECKTSYENLDVSKGIPPTVSNDLIDSGVRVQKGKYLVLNQDQIISPYKVFGTDGMEYQISDRVIGIIDVKLGSEWTKPSKIPKYSNSTYDSDSSFSDYSDSDYLEEEANPKPGLLSKMSDYFLKVFKPFLNIFIDKLVR